MKKKIFFVTQLIFFFLASFSQKKEIFSIFPTDDKFVFDICLTHNKQVLGIADNTSVKAYLIHPQKLIAEFRDGHTDKILSIDISKDSTLLASSGRDGKIVIWDFIRNSIEQTFQLDDEILTSVSISPDSKYLLVGDSEGKIRIYNLENHQLIYELTDHKKDITSVKFSPDGKYFVSASADKTINIYQVENVSLIAKLKGHKSWIRDLSFNKDGTELYSCGDDSKIITWNLENYDNIFSQTKNQMGFGWITGIDHHDGSQAFVSINGKIEIETIIGSYGYKVNKPVSKVLFKPNKNRYVTVIAATLGKGVIMVNAEDMKSGQK